MNISEMIFVGVKSTVVAYSKLDGRLLWATTLKSGFLSKTIDFVTVLLEGDRIYAHTSGELFCLDALSGQQIWNNEMKGLGFNIASLATQSGSAPSAAIAAAAQMNSQNNAAASGNSLS